MILFCHDVLKDKYEHGINGLIISMLCVCLAPVTLRCFDCANKENCGCTSVILGCTVRQIQRRAIAQLYKRNVSQWNSEKIDAKNLPQTPDATLKSSCSLLLRCIAFLNATKPDTH